MKQSDFPEGRDEARVSKVIAHYTQQSEEQAVAEDEAAFESTNQMFVEVPNDLLPAVRELIAKHKGHGK